MATQPWWHDDPQQIERRERERQFAVADRAHDQRMGEIARRKRLRGADVVVRAACAELLRPRRLERDGVRFDGSAAEVARTLYRDCPATLAFIARAAVAPATTATPTWAAELVETAVADFLIGDEARPPSAFAQLARRALSVGASASTKVPSRVHPWQPAGAWIGEGSVKPVFAVNLGVVTLAQRKLAAISVWSEEIAEHSTPSIEAIVRDALRHDLGALVDLALLDATAATALRPAGLFAGASAVPPSVSTPASAAMIEDLQALTVAVTTGAPTAVPVFIAPPKQALRIRLTAPDFANVIESGFMAADDVGCIDAASVALMLGDLRFSISTEAVVHMSDTPLQFADGAVVASPSVSLWQQDQIGLRSVLAADWKLRRSGAAALAVGVSW